MMINDEQCANIISGLACSYVDEIANLKFIIKSLEETNTILLNDYRAEMSKASRLRGMLNDVLDHPCILSDIKQQIKERMNGTR